VDIQSRDEMIKITTRLDEMGEIGRSYNALANYFGALSEDIVQVSQGLEKGNLRVIPQAEYKGDFVRIKNALGTGLSNLRLVIEDIVQVSQGLAAGDLRVIPKASYSGDFIEIKNALEIALSDLGKVIEDIVQVSQGMATGSQNVTTKAKYRGEFFQIKNSLDETATKLTKATAKNAIQDWLKMGQAQLKDKMSGEQEIVTLAKNIISFLTTYVDALVGVFYSFNEPDSENQKPYLQVIASYAFTENKNVPNKFLLGEGLVGQVALERQAISRTHAPEEYVPVIQSSLAQAVPRHVLIIPFLYEDAVKGIIEIGSTQVLTDIQKEFIEQVMPNIGIAINTAESRTQMQILLEQSREQAEELQGKQAELQQNNEELKSQTEQMQAQSEELQTQQEELRQTNEELEERTRELERQKVKIQQKNFVLEQNQTDIEKARSAIEIKAQELELASKYKSEFLANMSHELRTPLNSLLILAQLLTKNKTGNLTEEQVEYARTMHSAGSDLLTLINEILDLSKVEAGKIDLHFEDISLADLIDTLNKKFYHVAQDKGLDFSITAIDDLPTILHTDSQRLHQIINNLLSNAFKFTAKGEIKLTIRYPLNSEEVSFIKLDPAKTIAISVTDTGIGISKDKLQVVFEAFQQADGSTSRRYGGTGLGLSISRQLARLLGGELQLESEEGKGSTFTLYLPEKVTQAASVTGISPSVATPKTTKTETSTHIISSEDKPIPDISQKNELSTDSSKEGESSGESQIVDDRNNLKSNDKSILIIEDDRRFSKILIELARDRGFKCLIAENGSVGLQMAQDYQPNSIILDVNLPQLDGWTVMERLKDHPDTRHIPVHFMTASEQNKDAKKMGAIGYLLKPVSMDEMNHAFQKIEGFLSKTLKNLLVIVDNEARQQKIMELVESDDVKISLVTTNRDSASQSLHSTEFDCIILDVDFERKTCIEILKLLKQEESLSQIPVIIYADRELTLEEENALLQCEEQLTVKMVRSKERLLDEATLFLHQVEANLSQEKRQMLQMVHDKTAILKNKKVLIVDDDMRNVFVLATVLEEQQMEVIVADNGKDALEMLDEHTDTNIVLMDIMMPEMDGYEAMQKIRKQPRFRQLPIIALTAKAMKGDKAKCIEAGANDYLSKPVDADKLLSLLRVWLYR
ncbi:response regulator, partial [Candidatus Marithioploca araucensis]|nr:response regulator [Candidatus Marithioploca araucensis]